MKEIVVKKYLIEAKEKLAKELGCQIEDLDQYLFNENITSHSSELKNTCNRCNKIWYLGADELEDLERRLTAGRKAMNLSGGMGVINSLFNPVLGAQQMQTMATTTDLTKSLVDELNEKSRCPECQSKNIDRVLVDGNEKIDEVRASPPQETNKKGEISLADELKKLSDLKEQGLLDEEEFKTAKRKLMED